MPQGGPERRDQGGQEACGHPQGLAGAQALEVNLGFLRRALERQGLLLGLYRACTVRLPEDVAGRLARAEQELDLSYIQAEVPKVLEEATEAVERLAGMLRRAQAGPDAAGGYVHVS